MREAGLIDRWRNQWWRPPASCPSTHPGSARAMHMASLTGIFLAVVTLSLVGMFVFTIEYYMCLRIDGKVISLTDGVLVVCRHHTSESNERTKKAFVHTFEMHLRL